MNSFKVSATVLCFVTVFAIVADVVQSASDPRVFPGPQIPGPMQTCSNYVTSRRCGRPLRNLCAVDRDCVPYGGRYTGPMQQQACCFDGCRRVCQPATSNIVHDFRSDGSWGG